MIPDSKKDETIKKLNVLLKKYLVKTFETNGYDPNEKTLNQSRSGRAQTILATIGKIHQDKEIEKETLEKLFDMYKTYV